MTTLDLPLDGEEAVDERDIGELVDGDLDVKVGMLLSESEGREQRHGDVRPSVGAAE